MKIEIDDDLFSEFKYLAELHGKSGTTWLNSPEKIIIHVLRSVADGSRRPGSWERGMLTSTGITCDRDEHHVYRAEYGAPRKDQR